VLQNNKIIFYELLTLGIKIAIYKAREEYFSPNWLMGVTPLSVTQLRRYNWEEIVEDFMKKIFGLVAVVIALVLIGCAVPTDFEGASRATLSWNGAEDRDVAAGVIAVENTTRSNASGPKITSNAHSAAFPGIYFIWDSKQKDNGFLKVAANVFDNYGSFVLTAKMANEYWDFPIAKAPGQELTPDGCYTFFIPKVTGKNINMVFIPSFELVQPEVPVVINLGFIGYYVHSGIVMSTSIHWQNLEKEGDMINWNAVDAAYDAWVAQGGLAPKRDLWQTSGYASFTFADYAALGYGDFSISQIESYYLAYYVDPGYVLVCECPDCVCGGKEGEGCDRDGCKSCTCCTCANCDGCGGTKGEGCGGFGCRECDCKAPVVKWCENCEGNAPDKRCGGVGCAGNGKGAPGGDQGGGKGNQNQQ